jgi:putative salt-induced outer membrane protein YdiY
MQKLKVAAEQGDVTAMTSLQFSYSGSRMLWQLDDNTIVMDELAIEQTKLDALASKFNITINIENFDVKALRQF